MDALNDKTGSSITRLNAITVQTVVVVNRDAAQTRSVDSAVVEKTQVAVDATRGAWGLECTRTCGGQARARCVRCARTGGHVANITTGADCVNWTRSG